MIDCASRQPNLMTCKGLPSPVTCVTTIIDYLWLVIGFKAHLLNFDYYGV